MHVKVQLQVILDRSLLSPFLTLCFAYSSIVLQGCDPACIWTGEYIDAISTSVLLFDLCQYCGLSSEATQLWHADVLLRHSQKLREVRPYHQVHTEDCVESAGPLLQLSQQPKVLFHPLQVQDSGSKVLHLTAAFKVNLSFYLWYSFRWSSVRDHKVLAAIWQELACSYLEHNNRGLPDILLLQHTDELPLTALQCSGCPHPWNDTIAHAQRNAPPGLFEFTTAIKQLKAAMGKDTCAATVPWKTPDEPK